MYVDDSVIMFSSTNYKEYTKHSTIHRRSKQWFEHNKLVLVLNTSKTNYMIFDKNRKLNDSKHIWLTLNENKLNLVGKMKYLGLVIDEKLSWQEHITKIINKIRPIIFAIRRLTPYLYEIALQNIYNSHIIYFNIVCLANCKDAGQFDYLSIRKYMN